MKYFIITMLVFVLLTPVISSEPIAPNWYGDSLIQYLRINYKTFTTLGYDKARDTLYGVIDRHNDSLTCIYCLFSMYPMPPLPADPSTWAYNGGISDGINCEHTFPQSMGAGIEPARSDMHHLYPCKNNVNSSRGNDPYNEIDDGFTNTWYRHNYSLDSIPTGFIWEYAEKLNGTNACFEPRDSAKGKISRGIFYFYTMYKENTLGSNDSLFFNKQKDILMQWNQLYLPDSQEVARTWKIASYQNNNPNPFVIDPTLVIRAYFPEQSGLIKEILQEPDDSKMFSLSQNYPNPFNKITHIKYMLAKSANVNISIISIDGSKIRTIVNEYKKIGRYEICWDGRDNNGKRVKQGIYFSVLSVENKTVKMNKMILLR